jgi:hypothetical protein
MAAPESLVRAEVNAKSLALERQASTLMEVITGRPAGGAVNASTPFVASWEPALHRELSGALLVRFEPDRLRAATRLLSDREPVQFFDEKGEGLAAVYDAVVNRNVQAFLDVSNTVKRLFPHVRSVRLRNPTHQTKAMAVELPDGSEIGTNLMSEGLLYYLAFAILPYVDPVAVLLVEEPENGLHPARIAEVMGTLREVSKSRQVLVATHSPLVLNELQAEEISVVTRTEKDGTRVTRLKDTTGYEERAKVYAPGELWVSYANGTDEAPLLRGGPRP